MDDENEIEHFGFSAERVSLERKHFIRKILNNAFDVVLRKIDCGQDTSEHLLQQKERVLQNMWQSIGTEVKAADYLDKRNFTVPEHVLLPYYFDHVKMNSESDEEQIDIQLQMQRQMFLENSVVLASLKLENDRNRNLAKFVEDEVCMQRQLKESFNNLNMKEVDKLVDKTRAYI